MYDAALGRWHAVDPMSEKYYSWSPYTYCKNNPVLRIDLDGKDDYVISRSGRLFNETPIDINGKTNCSLFSKHFAQDFVLLTQNKMYILLFPIICFSDFVLSLLLLS